MAQSCNGTVRRVSGAWQETVRACVRAGRDLRTAISELANLCFSLDDDSLCLSESFFRGLLLSSVFVCHWLFITCCRRRPTQTSEEAATRLGQ